MARGDRERDESRSNSVNTMGFGREQSVRELEQIGRQQRYKADLDRQREELEKKRSAEKWREKEEEMKLEIKVKRDRERRAKEQQVLSMFVRVSCWKCLDFQSFGVFKFWWFSS